MEPGNQNSQPSLACLLPTGSASEEVEGISHLFEHIFVKILHNHYPYSYPKLPAYGHTTEDYVILFCRHFTVEDIMQTLERMNIEEINLENQKDILKEEIKRETSNREEFFFRFVWEGTNYEKSPLGSIARVDTITAAILEDFRRQLISKNILFYSREKGIEILNLSNSENSPAPGKPLSLPIAQTWKMNRPFREKWYNIYFFDRDIEAFYLLERVLKELNPARHIQLSEKKRMSALIVEKGADFPLGQNISFLKEKAFEGINKDLADIKANFREQAVNELESVYFYGQQWQDRVARLFNTTENQLSELVKGIGH